MTGPYVNDEGDIWIERGSAAWPRIVREARWMADELLDVYPNGILLYEGIDPDVRVSDNHEAGGVHGDDHGCADWQEKDRNDPAFEPCCRTIIAHHFRAVEP
jgi:hypothetical protein